MEVYSSDYHLYQMVCWKNVALGQEDKNLQEGEPLPEEKEQIDRKVALKDLQQGMKHAHWVGFLQVARKLIGEPSSH